MEDKKGLSNLEKIGAALGVLVLVALVYFGAGEFAPGPILPDSPLRFLVNETVSASAPIVVRIPEGIAPIEAGNASRLIALDPQVRGTWSAGRDEAELIFKPSQQLVIGRRYGLSVAVTASSTLSTDFLVAEDPKIVAIFPKADSEVNEESEITIIFNRPMVPVSTLDEVKANTLPIVITPVTPGRFKWISTRNLQFIPDERLLLSSNYKVEVKSGFTSVEGLPVSGMVHKFTTRPLRELRSSSKGPLRYNEPLRVTFNQAFDLELTKAHLILKDGNGKTMPFVALREEKNDSVLLVYPVKDSAGRERYWDLNSNYSLSFDKAYPAEGDIILDEKRIYLIRTTDIIAGLSAVSPRTELVSPELFDPEGTLEVNFYEDVNLDSSSIKVKGLSGIVYGEKCEEATEEGYYVEDCPKVPDKKRIILSFKPEAFSSGESFQLVFERIVNSSGEVINPKPIERRLKVYPSLRITKITPISGSSGASLTDLSFCATTPVKTFGKDNWKEAIVSEGYIAFNYWSMPMRATDMYPPAKCAPGEFYSEIRYGLIPETNYSMTLKLEDVFGQKVESKLSFLTEKPKEFYRRLGALQSGYSVTSPEKTKLTYFSENLEYVDISVCRVSPETMLGLVARQPRGSADPASFGCLSVISKRVELPKRYWVNNYFQINLADYTGGTVGHYVVSLGHPEYRDPYEKKIFYERTLVSVTRLAVGEKRINWKPSGYDYYYNNEDERNSGTLAEELSQSSENLYWVTRFGDQSPVAGALVSLYARSSSDAPISLSAGSVTNEKGIAKTKPVQSFVGAIVRSGLDSAIVSAVTDNFGYYTRPAMSGSYTYIYTDKPIYRPGDEVHLRGIDRIGYDGNHQIYAKEKAPLEIHNSLGEIIFERELPISSYGTFETTFTLPSDAALGGYNLKAFGGHGYFEVEEYVPAAFLLSVSSDKEEYLSGETAKIESDAKYYFGVPLEGGEVEYTITAQDYYFDKYQDEYFSFGAGWYSCYGCGYGDRFIKRGKGVIDAEGHTSISEKLDLDDLFKGDTKIGSKIFNLTLTAKDSTGRSVSSQTSFIVHRGDFYLGLKTDPYFAGKDEPFDLRVKSVDTKGVPTRVSGGIVTVNRIDWKTFKRREVDGRFYYRSEEVRTKVKTLPFSTDDKGDFKTSLSLLAEGQYELVATAEDSKGNKITATSWMYVWGDGEVEVRQTNNETLEIEADKSNVSVGDTASIIIKSPYKRAKALISVERGKVYNYELVDITGNIFAYKIPIKDEYVPNVFVSVLLISGDPEVKLGQLELRVDTKTRELSIETKTNKDKYLPGETVEMDVLVKNYKGEGVEAEVSLAVVDLSVLALAGNPKKDPVVFFYGGFPLSVVSASNIKNILHEADIPTGTKGGSGGGDAEDLASRKRGVFKDTAFWQANVVTAKDGKAHVSFKLPDNLTTWQVEALGVTADTLLGVDYEEFSSRKELSILALRPRFVVPGDTFKIGAKIFNETSSRQSLDVTLESDTLAIDSGRSKTSLAPGETTTLYFDVSAPKETREGSHKFILTAKGSGHIDTVEHAISITKNETPEVFATAGQSKGDVYEYVYVPKGIEDGSGELTISAQATLSRFMTSALEYMLAFPYGCSEQVASRLSSIATVKRALSLPNVDNSLLSKKFTADGQSYSLDEIVKIGLDKIYDNQTSSGGFAYFKGLKPSLHLSLHVVRALQDLKDAGYDIDESVLLRAVNYIENTAFTSGSKYLSNDTIISVAHLLSRMDRGGLYRTKALGFTRDRHYMQEEISSTALAELAIIAANSDATTQNIIWDTLENRIDIDGRGAYLSSAGNYYWQYYDTPVKNTALFLKALTVSKREHPLTDKVVRYLLKSRNQDGGWGTTNNTLAVTDAITHYLAWQRETESDFTLLVNYDGEKKTDFDVNPKTIFNDFSYEIPIDQITKGVLHSVNLDKTDRNKLSNNLYYDIVLRYFLPTEKIAARDEGFTISRGYYDHADDKYEKPKSEAVVGDVLVGHLVITVPKERNLVAVESFIPAGFELVNFNLDTERKQEEFGEKEEAPQFYNPGYYGDGESYQNFGNVAKEERVSNFYPDHLELRDDRLFMFKENLAPGVYTYDYYIRALVPGSFQELPARAYEFYTPENFGRTKGSVFTVDK